MNCVEFSDSEQQSTALANSVAARLGAAIASQGAAVLAVSGGKSPIPFFHMLSTMAIDWSKVSITLVDERFVPDSHPDSNAALVRAPSAARPRRRRALPTPGRRRAGYRCRRGARQRRFRSAHRRHPGHGRGRPHRFAISGTDELAAGLDPASAAAFLAVTPKTAPHRRVSMSYAALLRADCLILSIQGDKKRQVLDAAAQGVSDALPISHFLAQDKVALDVYWSA